MDVIHYKKIAEMLNTLDTTTKLEFYENFLYFKWNLVFTRNFNEESGGGFKLQDLFNPTIFPHCGTMSTPKWFPR